MTAFLEPVYLNEKMVMNCAAYLFKGVALETEENQKKELAGKGNLKLGFKFLSDILSPFSAGGEISKSSVNETKAARRYTVGGLHMTVLDALRDNNHLTFIENTDDVPEDGYIDMHVVLKPIDFYSILDMLKSLAPFAIQLLKDLGPMFKKDLFNKQRMKEIEKYGQVIPELLQKLEKDYLKSKQLEMIMLTSINPENQVGILDLDVTDYDPAEIKAKLTDGKFHVIGKVTKHIPENVTMSLLQRTSLSKLFDLLSKLITFSGEIGAVQKFQNQLNMARPYVDGICQLQIAGPAIRVMAMSVCV